MVDWERRIPRRWRLTGETLPDPAGRDLRLRIVRLGSSTSSSSGSGSESILIELLRYVFSPKAGISSDASSSSGMLSSSDVSTGICLGLVGVASESVSI